MGIQGIRHPTTKEKGAKKIGSPKEPRTQPAQHSIAVADPDSRKISCPTGLMPKNCCCVRTGRPQRWTSHDVAMERPIRMLTWAGPAFQLPSPECYQLRTW